MESNLNSKDWNRLVLDKPNTFFQSWEWGDLQEKLGRKAFRIVREGLPLHFYEYELALGKTYLYSPGLWMEGGPSEELIHEIGNLSPKAIFAKLEPLIPGAKISEKIHKGETIQPKNVGVVEIKGEKERLLKAMEHDTRYAIRTAEKRGVVVECVSDPKEKEVRFAEFWEVYSEMNDRKSLRTFPKRYYEMVAGLNGDCRSKIFIAKVDGKPINVALVIYFGVTANYQFAASKTGYGKFNAPSLTLWRIIEDSLQEGMTELNLGGMYSEGESKIGLTKFKKSFGAKEMVLPGAFDVPIKEHWYSLYSMAKKIRG